MSECNNCLSNNICSLDKRPRENCFFFSETEESRIKNSKEYRLGYEQCRADERAKELDEELQNFAQWLWDSHYLVNEAFTIRLVEQYKIEKLKEQK